MFICIWNFFSPSSTWEDITTQWRERGKFALKCQFRAYLQKNLSIHTQYVTCEYTILVWCKKVLALFPFMRLNLRRFLIEKPEIFLFFSKRAEWKFLAVQKSGTYIEIRTHEIHIHDVYITTVKSSFVGVEFETLII